MLSSILPKKNEKIRLYCYDTSGQIHSFFGRIRHQKHISKLTDLYLFDVQFVLQSFYYNCILNLHTRFFFQMFSSVLFSSRNTLKMNSSLRFTLHFDACLTVRRENFKLAKMMDEVCLTWAMQMFIIYQPSPPLFSQNGAKLFLK